MLERCQTIESFPPANVFAFCPLTVLIALPVYGQWRRLQTGPASPQKRNKELWMSCRCAKARRRKTLGPTGHHEGADQTVPPSRRTGHLPLPLKESLRMEQADFMATSGYVPARGLPTV